MSKKCLNSKKMSGVIFGLEHWHIVALMVAIYDYGIICISYALALWFRFDCHISEIPAGYMKGYLSSILIYASISVLIFIFMNLYKSIWRFASYNELIRIVTATVITSGLYIVFMTLFITRMPISYYLFGTIMQFLSTLGIRFSYRFVLLLRGRNVGTGKPKTRVMIIGAGNAGQMIFRDVKASRELNEKAYCFIDDNPNKTNRYIDGVPIVGGREYILEAVDKYKIEKIYLAIPSAKAEDKRDILNICSETSCKLMNLPGMYQLSTGEVTVSNMKQVAVEDLLGREAIKADMTQIFRQLQGKVVLVTGGGGSIGSELCRQIAGHKPKQLIIFDVYENNAYDIQLELRDKYPHLDVITLIGSVRDSRRIFQIFETYKPEYVYHAAAHKHVPLMEDSPCEAIKNNAIGTYKTAYAAMVNGCKRFVLISTDKAVNPTNIMGASKRLCEMICQSFDKMIKEGRASDIPQLFTHEDKKLLGDRYRDKLSNSNTEFVAVRFGNVLGSNGSVIPLFKKQIESGGPVTVTHPDIIRYFMTIPEAVGLVLQAGTYAHGGEIFVLDMGEPVKIDTLARNLIRLSGLKPDIDIKIEYSGLRPGEKLYEERLMTEEGLQATPDGKISIGKALDFDINSFFNELNILMSLAYSNDIDKLKEVMPTIVKTYKIPIDA